VACVGLLCCLGCMVPIRIALVPCVASRVSFCAGGRCRRDVFRQEHGGTCSGRARAARLWSWAPAGDHLAARELLRARAECVVWPDLPLRAASAAGPALAAALAERRAAVGRQQRERLDAPARGVARLAGGPGRELREQLDRWTAI
jgi:hypothetical protein